MLNAELQVLTGSQAGSVIPLVSGRFLIGREEDCHLRPSNDLVSRHHCVFKTDEFTVRVRDLGSTNGTFVNGERLRGEVMLNTGDKVKVGTLEFEVAITEGAVVGEGSEAPATLDGDPDTSQTMIELPEDGALMDTGSFQGDTVYQPPQQQPYGQPMPIGYQMPYPQQPYGYGQPYGMPPMGYPQQPMPYPQQPMGYPQQPMPMPGQQQTPPPATVEDPASAQKQPSVSLPDPSTTGAKPPEPEEPSQNKGQSNQGAVSNTAQDIIKQYTQRRPGGAG